MVALLVSRQMKINSHKGQYRVNFQNSLEQCILSITEEDNFFLIDSKVAKLYSNEFSNILKNKKTIIISSNEKNKSIENVIKIIKKLLKINIRRNQVIVAIGGGIIQDITCFISSTLFRGLNWYFIPTTLLAQADSCIGSKSSINLGITKNILGTFNPPSKIIICPVFLNTLNKKDINSGIGEIIKVHIIEGNKHFHNLKKDFHKLLISKNILLQYVKKSLLIKKKYIEVDEFDKGKRNIFNYGHSFGHAIESATNFKIPHGIAITIGMDMANHIAMHREYISKDKYLDFNEILTKNYQNYKKTIFSFDDFYNALKKDKKNSKKSLNLIFPYGKYANIKRISIKPDELFKQQCKNYIKTLSNKF